MATPNLNLLHESPFVQINIRNESQNTVNAIGTNIFLTGFTPQGPTDEPTNVSSLQEFEEIFGLPETPAERYAYNAAKQILETSPGALLFTRTPYGSGAGIGFADTVNALIFPMVAVSAVEITPCEYYRNVDETTCRVSFPWLYTNFVNTSICYGSQNLECPLNSSNEDAGYLYIHNTPFDYASVMTGFKFVVDADSTAENLRIFQLRPTTSGYNTTYSVVTSISLSSVFANIDEDQSNLSSDSKRLIVNLENTSFARELVVSSGLLSGSTLSGIFVSAGDVFGTFAEAGAPVLKYFNASKDVAASYKTSITSITNLSAGVTFTAVTTAVNNTEQDFLISFCGKPVEAGLSCATITALGLTVPEEDRYTFYPVGGDAQLNDANFYVFGAPISKSLNQSEYQLLLNEQFNWKCGAFENVEPRLDVVNNDVRAGFIIINEAKTAQLEDFSGYYLAVNDNLNVNPSTDFDNLTGINSYYQEVCPGVSGEWITLPEERWNFKVSETFNGTAGSIAEIIEKSAGIDFGKPAYNDSLIISLFKLVPTRMTDTINKLEQRLVEKFAGSLNVDRKVNDSYGGPPRSYFLENAVNNGSNYLKVLVNPYLSNNNCWNDNTGKPQKTVRMFRERTSSVFSNYDAQAQLQAFGDNLYGVGVYNGHCRDELYELCQKKDIGNLPAKLERALRNVENSLEYPIDITIDAGLSTIWATRQAVANDSCITSPTICYHYDDTYFVDTESLSPFDGTSMSSAIGDAWEVIYNTFDSFARFTRKAAGGTEHFHIQDPLRQIFVNGRDFKVIQRQKQLLLDTTTNQPTEKYATFSRNIWAYLRNLTQSANSAFSQTHGNWIKDYDANTDKYCWFGPSAHKAALFARNDSAKFPWNPAFGTTYGSLPNIVDLAINPNQRERDLLSRIGVNPIVRFPEGNVVYNSLTLLKEDSALREDYIVRGLIWLAKSMQSTLRPYIGIPNTVVTRTRVTNDLDPLLKFMKNNSGVYDYKIVCNELNNSRDTIDKGILNVAVYVQPVRATKFILVDLVVTRTGIDFNSSI